MQQQKLSSFAAIPLPLIWLLACYFVAYRLGAYAVLDNNEGLYAEISREMLHSAKWENWIIPHLNGLAYMEKPPLLYWLTASALALFGEHEWVVRLSPALSCLGCVGLLLWFGRRVGLPAVGQFAAVVFVSSLGVTAMARTLMFDMLLTFFLTGAVMHAYLYIEQQQRAALYRAMALLAGALLAKGFVALILFSAIMGSYLLSCAKSPADFLARLRRCLDWRGLLVFFALAAPWHLAAMLTEPIFTWFYFINEHVLRFLGKREPHDYYAGAWWYYLPRMIAFLFPWSLLLPVLLLRRPVDPAVAAAVGTTAPRSLQRFLLLAWLMPLVFFSISSAKANYYLVVVMPLAAMQLATLLAARWPSRRLAWLPGCLGAALFAAILWHFERLDISQIGPLAGWPAADFLRAALGVLLLASLAASALASRSARLTWYAYLLIPLLSLPLLLQVLAGLDTQTSTRALVDQLQRQAPAREVLLYRVFEQQSSLPFYLKRAVRIVDSRSNDLFWGNKLHKNKIVIDDAAFVALAQTQTVDLLVLEEDLPDFQQKNYFTRFKSTRQVGKTWVFSN
ncbi:MULTISPECIES: glycosyltransferase family 39 protein [unclassified Undibacterium]|uniref:ArnT family glycosyltransferase n=1 Tax=unclassified Undibacterium TaxID=2630295 RepID=UPI002AC97861|nr:MULTISPECIES: glycosyltransferase family 39 protein [unclassified Undibacterium]MEB0138750.1 glycosyltransferase family 39 protein [Undibacterium sp. CCC2.1]MEB0171551.1 glycosyltransferase family 39 protein [Undibacterium sp. CCC1.1]MEB0175378.1 glycosyltransferase family 39 protein [Undibacterium sp. CCC3.4]MEB0214751.1 glycosyltransferase family 39 protein [Undibacterium sp. 5I2]WPX43291.1 glycosyltransferase family 39 protein [Undibacterium sp. CCC3.4]